MWRKTGWHTIEILGQLSAKHPIQNEYEAEYHRAVHDDCGDKSLAALGQERLHERGSLKRLIAPPALPQTSFFARRSTVKRTPTSVSPLFATGLRSCWSLAKPSASHHEARAARVVMIGALHILRLWRGFGNPIVSPRSEAPSHSAHNKFINRHLASPVSTGHNSSLLIMTPASACDA